MKRDDTHQEALWRTHLQTLLTRNDDAFVYPLSLPSYSPLEMTNRLFNL